MKLLVVFVSALVLVAHGNVTPSDEDDSVYEVQSEVVAGYAVVAGQEADGPQGVFAEEVPVVQAFGAESGAGYAVVAGQEADGPQGVFAGEVPVVQAFGAEAGPRLGSPQEPAAENDPIPEDGVYIPIDTRACNLAKCNQACRRLGMKGKCKNNMCRCY